jgi:N-acetylglucosaminyldiphosphoundecaprenol N-acetyl-beta-D-mannosaminyltransferase
MAGGDVNLCGVRVDVVGYSEILDRIDALFDARSSGIVCYSHFHTLLEARKDIVVRELLNASALNHPDGIGIGWALRVLTKRHQPRVNGTDLYPQLIRHLAEKGRRMYFLGGSEEAVQSLRTRINSYFPESVSGEAVLAGIHHGMFSLEDRSVVEDISAARPDVLFVGLGSPKQYYWIRMHQAELEVPLAVLVGGGIEFLSGRRRRAPRPMRLLGLEWLHRLVREPRHCWRRYVIGIPKFVLIILKEALTAR